MANKIPTYSKVFTLNERNEEEIKKIIKIVYDILNFVKILIEILDKLKTLLSPEQDPGNYV